jgi:hypothetical protein
VIKGTCKVVYRVVKIRPDTNAKVKDPVTKKKVNGCQWTSLDGDSDKADWECAMTGLSGLYENDVVPYMTINGAPIICDA